MIDHNHALPITRQAELVGISRGDVYYLPRAVSKADQQLMKRIDALNLAHPFAGSRMLRDMLNREGFQVSLTVSQDQLCAYSTAAWALPEAGDQCVAEAVPQGRDRMNHVPLRAQDCPGGCNPREGQALGVR
jgi:hypothetical protein